MEVLNQLLSKRPDYLHALRHAQEMPASAKITPPINANVNVGTKPSTDVWLWIGGSLLVGGLLVAGGYYVYLQSDRRNASTNTQ